MCRFAASAADLKIATVAPDGSHWMQQMRAGADEIKTRTDGRVTIKFYPGGVMGNDSQVLRKIRAASYRAAALTAGGLAERYAALNLYGIPLMFRSLDEVDAVRSAARSAGRSGPRAGWLRELRLHRRRLREPASNEPIHSVNEMRRKKVWVPDGDEISFLAMQELGLSPVTSCP